LVVSYALAHSPFCPGWGIVLNSYQAVFYRLKERCAIFIWQGPNSWPLALRYSHDLNSNHTKPLPFQDCFYRYYKTLPKPKEHLQEY
jgi:heme O synthase-like polyprenyltransferase